MMRFCDLPIGARFKYPGSKRTWVVMEPYRDGLIAEWKGPTTQRERQSLCSFCGEGDDLTIESEVEVVE